MNRLWLLLVWLGLGAGCGGGWASTSALVADPHRVAQALGDPTSDVEAAPLPVLDEPGHPRTCCAFGMDLHVDFASIEVPFFEVGNVISAEQLGAHAYSLPMGAPEVEGNGLVYTCRGGWVDTAHVRENADVHLFLTLAIAPLLRTGGVVEIPGHGAPTRIEIVPLEVMLGDLIDERPLELAAALAAWITFRIGIWHEVATWYGYEMVGGFSEQPSAFSPEDLYSNALGIRLSRAIIAADRFTSSPVYEEAIVAYIREALIQLGALPVAGSRSVMEGLDGLWWDSTQRLPNNALVLRRAFPEAGHTVAPWRAQDAFDDAPASLEAACGAVPPRTLLIADHVAGHLIRDLVDVSFSPEGWATDLPVRDPHHVQESELDALVTTTHEDMEAVMGEGFDAPRGAIEPPREDAP